MSSEICLNYAFAEDDSIEDVLNQEYAKGYQQGRADALNIDLDTPMHFTPEQKAWVKKYIAINGERQRTDGAREFAEWLCGKSDYTDIDINGFITCRCGDSPRDITIEQALSEWQKEVENV